MNRSSLFINEETVGQWFEYGTSEFMAMTDTTEKAAELKQAVRARVFKRLKVHGLVRLLNLVVIVGNVLRKFQRTVWKDGSQAQAGVSTYRLNSREISYLINAALIAAWIEASFPYFLRLTRNEGKARDLAGNILVKLLKMLRHDKLKKVKKLDAYIKSAAKRQVISQWKKERRLYDRALDDDEGKPRQISDNWKGVRTMNNGLDLKCVFETMKAKLDEDCQRVLKLWAQNYSVKEIAKICEMPEKIVRAAVARGRYHLRRKMAVRSDRKIAGR